MCWFYICSLFSFQMFLCTTFKTKRCILLDPRWSPLGRFGNANAKIASDFQVWESAKNVEESPTMVLISLAFWNLRPHYPNLTFWRSYGHIVIDSVSPIPSIFFPSEVAGSHTIRWHGGFFVERHWDMRVWQLERNLNVFFYSILLALNENLALPCEASSQTVCFHLSIGQK